MNANAAENEARRKSGEENLNIFHLKQPLETLHDN